MTTLRCKPGDLCLVIHDTNIKDSLIGCTVLIKEESYQIKGHWVLDDARIFNVYYLTERIRITRDVFPDDWLLPITPPDNMLDEESEDVLLWQNIKHKEAVT